MKGSRADFSRLAETGLSHTPFQCHCHSGGAQSMLARHATANLGLLFFSFLSLIIISAFHGGSHFLSPCMGVEMVATRGKRSYTVVDMFLVCSF